MATLSAKKSKLVDIVFFGSYIILLLTVFASIYWYSVTYDGLVKKHDFSITMSIVPFIFSAVIMTLGNYVNMKNESSNKKLTFIGSLMSGIIAAVMGYVTFLILKTILFES